MYVLKRLVVLGGLCLLFGCGTDSEIGGPNTNQNSVELTKISTKQNNIEQDTANQAKDFLKKNKKVTAVNAVNTKDKLLVGIKVPHHERFQLAKIRKKIKDDLKKEFSDVEVELSTDQKIILELEKLEEKLQNEAITKEELEKEFKHILNLSKEQT